METQILSFASYQQQVDDWIQSIGGRYFSPLSMMAQLTEEVGEVARVINRTHGEQTFKASEKDKNLPDELAGVLFAVTCIANSLDISLEEALRTHLNKITKRDATRFESLKQAANS